MIFRYMQYKQPLPTANASCISRDICILHFRTYFASLHIQASKPPTLISLRRLEFTGDALVSKSLHTITIPLPIYVREKTSLSIGRVVRVHGLVFQHTAYEHFITFILSYSAVWVQRSHLLFTKNWPIKIRSCEEIFSVHEIILVFNIWILLLDNWC